MIHLRQFTGDSHTHSIPLTWQGEAFTPGASWSLLFTLKAAADDLDTQAIAQKATGAGITVTGSTAAVAMVPQDTAALDHAERIPWDIQAQHLTTGELRTVAAGRMTITRDITREAQSSIPIHTTEPPVPFSDPDVVKTTSQTLTEEQKNQARQNIEAASLAQGALAESAVQPSNPAMTNARTPIAHKSTHATGGSDPLTPADIGAASSADLSLLAIDVGNQIAKDAAANNYGTVVTLTESRTLLSGDIGNTIDLAGFDLTMATGFVTAGDSVAIKGTGNVIIGGTPAPLDGSATIVMRYYSTGWESFSVSSAGVTSYNDLTDLPTLGSAAALDASEGGNGDADRGKVSTYVGDGELRAYGFEVVTGDPLQVNALGLSPSTLGLFDFTTKKSVMFQVGPNTLSSDRILSVPNASGTIALTSDLTGLAADNTVVHLAGTEDITGSKTFSGAVGFTSTTRPTTNGTGTPASNSLISLADADSRYGGQHWFIKGAKTTVNNSVGLVNSQLVSETLAVGTYVIDFMIDIENGTSSAPGQKLKPNFTGTATGDFNFSPDTGNFTALGATVTQATGYGWRRVGKGYLIVTAPGVFSWQFAQSTANASDTDFMALSWMEIHKVG